MHSLTSLPLVLVLMLAGAALSPMAQATTPAEQLAGYAALAGAAPQPARGQQLFTTRHGKDWSCASCHAATPTDDGRHASTGKQMGPLAPAFNPERFTDTARVEKWFRRNCNDVLGRVCTAGEKADVLAWLMTFKR